MSDLVRRLRERRIGQWAIAYLASAWLFLEAFDFVVATFGWPAFLVRSATLLAAVGFFVVVVMAWYHGQRGRQRMRGRELGLLAVLPLVAAVALSFWGRPGGEGTHVGGRANVKSVAVLPFTAISRSEEDLTFADGIHEDVITQLAKISDLRVIARTSVMAYRDAEERVSKIGRDLGVVSVLEGSVRRAGDRVRVVAQLIDVETEDHLWAETYDRDYSDIFAIQSDVAQNIADALRATLTPEEKQSIEEPPTQNLEAYTYYLRGNYYVANRWGLEGLRTAAQMYEKATELDPRFAIAYAKLATVHARLYVPSSWDHTPERLQACKAALATAMEIAPELAEVHQARGVYLEWIESDYEGALAAYRRALRDRPNDSGLLTDMGLLLLGQGKAEEATELLIESYERDPKSANQGYHVGWAYMLLQEGRGAPARSRGFGWRGCRARRRISPRQGLPRDVLSRADRSLRPGLRDGPGSGGGRFGPPLLPEGTDTRAVGTRRRGTSRVRGGPSTIREVDRGASRARVLSCRAGLRLCQARAARRRARTRAAGARAAAHAERPLGLW